MFTRLALAGVLAAAMPVSAMANESAVDCSLPENDVVLKCQSLVLTQAAAAGSLAPATIAALVGAGLLVIIADPGSSTGTTPTN